MQLIHCCCIRIMTVLAILFLASDPCAVVVLALEEPYRIEHTTDDATGEVHYWAVGGLDAQGKPVRHVCQPVSSPVRPSTTTNDVSSSTTTAAVVMVRCVDQDGHAIHPDDLDYGSINSDSRSRNHESTDNVDSAAEGSATTIDGARPHKEGEEADVITSVKQEGLALQYIVVVVVIAALLLTGLLVLMGLLVIDLLLRQSSSPGGASKANETTDLDPSSNTKNNSCDSSADRQEPQPCEAADEDSVSSLEDSV